MSTSPAGRRSGTRKWSRPVDEPSNEGLVGVDLERENLVPDLVPVSANPTGSNRTEAERKPRFRSQLDVAE
jgi:hypothetical protein